MKKFIVAIALIAAASAANAQQYQDQQQPQTVRSQSFTGGLLGTVGGAYIGSLIGGGRGRIAAMAVGAIAGGIGGSHAFGTDVPAAQAQQPVQQNPNYAGGNRRYVVPDQSGPCDGETQIDGEYNPPAARALCRGKLQRAKQQQAAYEKAAYQRGLSGEE